MSADLIGGDYMALAARKLTVETCRKFGYQVGEFSGKPVQIANYWDDERQLVAQHVRFKNKDFRWLGNAKKASLFGQHLWNGGKKIVVTEGEIDCMTVAQVQGLKWPTVSLPNGAASAKRDIARNIQWFDQFEEVILMFDQDEPGQKAAKETAMLFRPGHVKIATLPAKDPNELLLAGKSDEIIKAIWNAKEYRPDGIQTLEELREELLQPPEWGKPWPWPTLTKATYGRRPGEVYVLGAGVGIGKTDVFTQIISQTCIDLQEACGIFYLEQQNSETGKRIAGKIAGRPFHVPDGGWTEEELHNAVDQMLSGGKLYFYNHFGSTDWAQIKSHIRYMALALDVKHIFLDHLTALASHAEDERRFLDGLLEEIASLAQELQITFYIISHLATPDGTPHEEGGRVMAKHFRGSRAIMQWAFFMFGLEADRQAEDEVERRTTYFRILKDRYTGKSQGLVMPLLYDPDTGILNERDEGPGEPELPDDPDECPF